MNELPDDSDYYHIARLEAWVRDFGKDHQKVFVDDVKYVLRKLAEQRGHTCMFDWQYDEHGEPIIPDGK